MTRIEVEFRGPRSADELRQLLRLRHRAFRGAKLLRFEPDAAEGFVLDGFDRRARHFGMFTPDGRPVSYVRVIDTASDHGDPFVRELDSSAVRDAELPLPLMSYWPEREGVEAIGRLVDAPGGRVFEVSRISIDERYRSPLTLGRMMECIATVAAQVHPDAILTTCIPRHRPYYERLGFDHAPGTTDVHVPGVGVGACLMLTLDQLAPRVARRSQAMVEQFRRDGAVRVSIVATRPQELAA